MSHDSKSSLVDRNNNKGVYIDLVVHCNGGSGRQDHEDDEEEDIEIGTNVIVGHFGRGVDAALVVVEMLR